ncbi:YitT family protein [Sporomusa sp.]|uniref:YitT family protein n=1 Tax=Sporomusa sp. TaxID=2078658 RepID=UPI002B58C31F|nr:YitT family protein [Sporomusa sp.]HWR45489.1 YitT family protein [Sporomusa sp.]
MKKAIIVLFGCLLTSVGILILKHANITTGGSTGLALNLSYLLQLPFPYVFVIVNLPFFILSIKKMGWGFTWATVYTVIVVSLLTGTERMLPAFTISSWVGAIFGSGILGLGLAFLLLGRSPLGGVGVLTVYLHNRTGWNPGKINLGIDTVVVISGIFTVGLWESLFSVVSVTIIAAVISSFKNRIAHTYNATSPMAVSTELE